MRMWLSVTTEIQPTRVWESSMPPLVMLALVHLRERVGIVARKDAMLGIATR